MVADKIIIPQILLEILILSIYLSLHLTNIKPFFYSLYLKKGNIQVVNATLLFFKFLLIKVCIGD
jgi:hypothetical protein